MKSIDLLTLIISGIALVASSLALYFQFFHRKTAILGRLLHINYDFPDENFERELNYSIINLGNQEILLNDVEFLEGYSTRGRAHDSYTVHKYKCSDSPYVLKPGEIKVLKIFTKVEKSEPETNSKKRYFIMFVFASAEGKVSEIYHDITKLHSRYNKEEAAVWKPFTLKDAVEEI